MPEVRFRVRLPDDTELDCYSPSRVIKDFLEPGRRYALGDFMARSREALVSRRACVTVATSWLPFIGPSWPCVTCSTGVEAADACCNRTTLGVIC